MVKQTCVKKFNVTNVTHSFIYNFSEYLKPFFKKYINNSSQAKKFTIMAYRQIKYQKEGLFCTSIANSTGSDHFVLEKIGVNFKYPMENVPKLYSKILQIKRAKLLDGSQICATRTPMVLQSL